MKNWNKLRDVVPDFTDGFFSHMSSLPFATVISVTELDVNFMIKYGQHWTGSLIDLYVNENDTPQLTDEQMTTISSYLYNKYKIQWQHLYDVLSLEYKALDNTYRTETVTETDNLTIDKTNTNNGENTVSGTVTDTTTDTQTNNTTQETNGTSTATGDSTDAVWGFNSSDAVNSNKSDSSSTSNGETTITDTGTIKVDGTKSQDIDNTTTFNNTNKDTGTENRAITRKTELSGSIGVITPQQMMQQEVDFWKYNFYDRIMEDIKNELVISIY